MREKQILERGFGIHEKEIGGGHTVFTDNEPTVIEHNNVECMAFFSILPSGNI